MYTCSVDKTLFTVEIKCEMAAAATALDVDSIIQLPPTTHKWVSGPASPARRAVVLSQG